MQDFFLSRCIDKRAREETAEPRELFGKQVKHGLGGSKTTFEGKARRENREESVVSDSVSERWLIAHGNTQ